MAIDLNQINPKFRQLTDLLLFSDRLDLDLSGYRQLLREKSAHFEYFWDRFQKSSDIFWENGEQFWFNRLSFLLYLNDKSLTKSIDEYLYKRMIWLIRNNNQIDLKYNIEFLQFVEYCKVKHARKESLLHIRAYLIEMPTTVGVDKLITIISAFTPFLFRDLDEYAEAISRKIVQSARCFELLLALEARGLKLDRQPIVRLTKEILTVRIPNDRNRRAFFAIINDSKVIDLFKKEYNSVYRDRILSLLRSCDFRLLEDHHLKNFKNIISLDPTIADDLAVIYADKLYLRGAGHKKANADRLIRLMKTIPEVTPKKVLAYLSSNNKMNDIKYILSSFPGLKKLAAFV